LSSGRNRMNGLNSWIDWRNMMPRDPLEVIANATFKAAVGTYTNSTTYITVPTSWATHSITYNTAPTVSALETDNQQMVADAAQWNFQHQTRSPSFSTLALALQRVAFVRGGTQWANTIQLIANGVTGPLDDWQLSFLDNAGTRGDAQGTVPVFSFGASV